MENYYIKLNLNIVLFLLIRLTNFLKVNVVSESKCLRTVGLTHTFTVNSTVLLWIKYYTKKINDKESKNELFIVSHKVFNLHFMYEYVYCIKKINYDMT